MGARADLSLDDKARALVLQPELRKLAQKLLLQACPAPVLAPARMSWSCMHAVMLWCAG